MQPIMLFSVDNINLVKALIESQGSVWIKRAVLKAALLKYELPDNIRELTKKKQLIAYYSDDEFYFTLPEYVKAENTVANHCMRIKEAPLYEKDVSSIITEAENKFSIKLHEQQKNAVKMAVKENICVITGGPGTGKTSVIKTILFVLQHIGVKSICLCAPTGKASKRMSEATGMAANTLHKKMDIIENAGIKSRTVFQSVTIVDEFSMVDLKMAATLFQSIQTGKKLILVGDINQLPSIGAGSVLRDIIRSNVIPVTMLAKTFRQNNDSVLFKNIVSINDGRMLQSGSDFQLLDAEQNKIKQILTIYKDKIQKYGQQNVVILTPFRKAGTTCSEKLNREIQKVVNNGPDPFCKIKDKVYKQGDPVIQLVNTSEVANGDVGIITCANESGITIQFEECEVTYRSYELDDNISLAYAMSIHKSQGSEYACVITTTLHGEEIMLQRNLLYTAVTRAQKECILIKDNDALFYALENVQNTDRVSFLDEKLKYLKNKNRLLGGK